MTSDATAASASASTMATTVTPPPPPPSSALSHETLRERILTGGGGIGNVRLSKVASLYADFLRALQQQPSSPSTTDAAAASADTNTAAIISAQHALQTELQLHDLEMHKLLLASRACDGNSARHDATLTQMQSNLASTRSEIQQLSSTLTKERQIKHVLEEYNALAKLGNSTTANTNNNKQQPHANPPICVTKSELNQVQQTIENVEREIKEAQLKVMVREKQLRVLMASLGDLKCALLEEEELKRRREQTETDGETNSADGEANVQKKRKRDEDTSNDDEDIGAL